MKRAFLSVVILMLCASAASAGCSDTQVDLRGDWGKARFTVEIADDPAERAQGLMHRSQMASGAGMLFLYDTPHRATFWMKNTLIPLDMLFLDAAGRVSHIHENAVPQDLTQIDGGDGVIAVLEINSGLVQAFGINVGSELRHSFFAGDEISWPCDAP